MNKSLAWRVFSVFAVVLLLELVLQYLFYAKSTFYWLYWHDGIAFLLHFAEGEGAAVVAVVISLIAVPLVAVGALIARGIGRTFFKEK